MDQKPDGIRAYLVFFGVELLSTNVKYIIFSLMTLQKVENLLPMNPIKQLRGMMMMTLVMMMGTIVLKPEVLMNTTMNTLILSIIF